MRQEINLGLNGKTTMGPSFGIGAALIGCGVVWVTYPEFAKYRRWPVGTLLSDNRCGIWGILTCVYAAGMVWHNSSWAEAGACVTAGWICAFIGTAWLKESIQAVSLVSAIPLAVLLLFST